MSMISWSGILLKRPVTLSMIRKLPARFLFLIWETQEESIFLRVFTRYQGQKVGDHNDSTQGHN